MTKPRVFYAARCTYWTDDFTKLAQIFPGIPCCPVCGSPGFESALKRWVEGGIKQSQSDPQYYAFLAWCKGRCFHNYTTARHEFERLLALPKASDLTAEQRGE